MRSVRRMSRPTALAFVATALLVASCSSDPQSSGADTQLSDADLGYQDAVDDEDAIPDVDLVEDADAVGDTGVDFGPVDLPTYADRERLDGVIELLSSDDMAGRLTGTSSGDLAEAAILDFLEQTGIETATQDVPFPLYEVGSPIELSIVDEEGTALTTFSYIDDYREVDFSGSGRVEGELVYVSYGLVTDRFDHYADVDVDGRIAVILTGVPVGSGLSPYDDGRLDVKIDEAYDHGAIGVLFVPYGEDASFDQARAWENELYATDKYGDFHAELYHAELPAAFVHIDSVESVFGVDYRTLARSDLGTTFDRRARLEVNGEVHENATCRNVFGIMRGLDDDLSDDVIILGAHYDHLGVGADGRIFNGAADNASGTGIVLETAASLYESGARPRRTVVFALWCAEEQGYWGSLEYGAYGTPLFPIADTRLMLQIDWIGGSDGPYLTNGDENALLTTFVGDERESEDLPLEYLDWGGGCASDDCVFSYLDVPAYRFIAYGAYHHVAEDELEILDMNMIGRVADICIRGIGHAAFE